MKEKPLSADEVFVNLIRVAQEDDRIGAFVKVVTGLDDFERHSLINTFIQEMAMKGAPAEFIKAIAALRDAQLCKKIREFLNEK